MTTSFKPSTDWNPFVLHATLLPTPADDIAWLLQRREGVGASDCAPVLGMGKWSGQTAYGVWIDKRGMVPLSTETNEAMEWGHLLEPVIAAKAAEKLGMQELSIGGLKSRTRPWQRASLDRVLITPDDGPVPLECKNTSVYLQSDWADDQVPDAAELQLQHQLAVTGAPYGYVAGLIGGNRHVVRRVDRDQELIDHINAEEEVFWSHVQDGTTPPVTARESLSDIITAAGTPDVDELVLDGPQASEARAWVAAYQQAQVDEKSAIAKKHEARNNLLVIAGGHTHLVEQSGDVLHTVVRVQRGVFSKKRFRDEEPDLVPLFEKKVLDVDTAAIKAEDPDLFARFQSRSIRLPKGA